MGPVLDIATTNATFQSEATEPRFTHTAVKDGVRIMSKYRLGYQRLVWYDKENKNVLGEE